MVFTKAYSNPKPISTKNMAVASAIEEEKKIAAMGLFELRDLACVKSLEHGNSWYMTCVSCAGLETCKIGRRVVEILESETKPEEKEKMNSIAKFNRRIQSGNVRGSNIKYALVGRDACIETLKQPDPIEYIVKMNGCLRSSAIARLKRWKERWPELFRDAIKKEGFSKVTSDILNDKNLRTHHNIELQEECKKHIRAAFAYPEGVFAYYSKVLNVTTKTAIRAKLKTYVLKYPDLDKELHISEWLKANRGTIGKHTTDKEPEEVMVHMAASVKKDSINDEVSVEDFLNEMDIPEAVGIPGDPKGIDTSIYSYVENKVNDEDNTEEANIKVDDKVNDDKVNDKANDKVNYKVNDAASADEKAQNLSRQAAETAFIAKRYSIFKEISKLDDRVKELQKEINEVQNKSTVLVNQLKTLDEAAHILGFTDIDADRPGYLQPEM